MASRSTARIHPELRKVARFLPRTATGPRLLPVVRWLLPRMLKRRSSADVQVHRVRGGSVRLHVPGELAVTPAPAMVWMHGGGFVQGSAAMDDEVCALFAHRLGIVVASVDYRLAPEHPFPAAIDDCHDALVWLAERCDVDSDRIAIGGASAGGGLAASLALTARERGVVAPAFQLLVYPMLDDRTALRTDVDERDFRNWNNRSNRFGWTSYLGHAPGHPDTSDIAVPARNDDLSDLPPTWIGVGTCDLFHDEDVAYAERLSDAGVPCELVTLEGAFHGFEIAAHAAITREWREAQLAALAAGLGVGGRADRRPAR